jgi:hypothetical protein
MFSRRWLWRMPSSGKLRCVVRVRTDVLKERIASIIRVRRIGVLETTLAVNSDRTMLQLTLFLTRRFLSSWLEMIHSSDTSVLTSVTLRHISEYDTLPWFVRFEAFKAVTMKYAIFCNVTPCDLCKYRRFGGIYCLHHQGGKNQQARNNVSTD